MDRDEAIKSLRETLAPGDTIYTIVRHVSSSGMSRVIDLYVIKADDDRGPRMQWLGFWASRALGWKMHPKHQGLVVGGCGMDMTFHVVYELSAKLFNDGYALKKELL